MLGSRPSVPSWVPVGRRIAVALSMFPANHDFLVKL